MKTAAQVFEEKVRKDLGSFTCEDLNEPRIFISKFANGDSFTGKTGPGDDASAPVTQGTLAATGKNVAQRIGTTVTAFYELKGEELAAWKKINGVK